jgi:ATP-dependent Clp protease protease subunit
LARRFEQLTPWQRFGLFLTLLDKGEDMSGTDYTPEEVDVTELEGMSPELDRALVRKTTAEAKIAEQKAKEAALQLKNIEASNDANRVLVISGAILETDEISNVLMRWSRRDPQGDITIYLNTPGGSVFDGNALGHTLDQLRNKGHKVTIYGAGTVLSMGAVLLQYADERVLAKDAVFMIHSLSGGVQGAIESVVDMTEMWKEVNDRLLTKLTERANISKAALARKVRRKELFLSAEEALKMGFCDRIE